MSANSWGGEGNGKGVFVILFLFFLFSFPFSAISGVSTKMGLFFSFPYDTDVYELRASRSLWCVCVLCIICHVQLLPFYVFFIVLFCYFFFNRVSCEKRIKPAM